MDFRKTLSLKDAIVTQITDAGEFSELDSTVAGTGEWIGTTGILRADGTFDGTTGAGKYEAELCNH